MCVADFIEAFIAARPKGSLISTGDIILAVRQSGLACEHLDSELAELAAAHAVARGCNIRFDGTADCQ